LFVLVVGCSSLGENAGGERRNAEEEIKNDKRNTELICILQQHVINKE
jgi:hypothetical protein